MKGLQVRRLGGVAWAMAIACALTACSSISDSMSSLWSGPPSLDWRGMRIAADSKANLNSPVPTDVVFVLDNSLMERLNALPAAKWFESRDEWMKTYPTQLQTKRFELVPGQEINITADQFGVKHAYAVLIFANYLDTGDHRVRVDQFHKGMLVTLGPKDVTVDAQTH